MMGAWNLHEGKIEVLDEQNSNVFACPSCGNKGKEVRRVNTSLAIMRCGCRRTWATYIRDDVEDENE